MCYKVQKSLSQLEALVRNLEIQVLEHHTRPRESDTLRVGPSSLYFNNPPGDFNACSILRATALHNSHFLFGIIHILSWEIVLFFLMLYPLWLFACFCVTFGILRKVGFLPILVWLRHETTWFLKKFKVTLKMHY